MAFVTWDRLSSKREDDLRKQREDLGITFSIIQHAEFRRLVAQISSQSVLNFSSHHLVKILLLTEVSKIPIVLFKMHTRIISCVHRLI